jgi:hypothetical protein
MAADLIRPRMPHSNPLQGARMKSVALPLAAIAVLFALFLPSAKAQTPSANPMQDQVTAAERSGLEALKTGDLTKFAAITADEAIFVDSHGAATKAQLLKNVAGFTLTDYSMDNVHSSNSPETPA